MFCSTAPMIFALTAGPLHDSDVLRGERYHRVIMQALKDRNPEVAASASSANICLAEETSGDDFDRRLNLVVEGVIDRHFGADRSLDGISRPDFVPYAEFKDVDDHED